MSIVSGIKSSRKKALSIFGRKKTDESFNQSVRSIDEDSQLFDSDDANANADGRDKDKNNKKKSKALQAEKEDGGDYDNDDDDPTDKVYTAPLNTKSELKRRGRESSVDSKKSRKKDRNRSKSRSERSTRSEGAIRKGKGRSRSRRAEGRSTRSTRKTRTGADEASLVALSLNNGETPLVDNRKRTEEEILKLQQSLTGIEISIHGSESLATDSPLKTKVSKRGKSKDGDDNASHGSSGTLKKKRNTRRKAMQSASSDDEILTSPTKSKTKGRKSAKEHGSRSAKLNGSKSFNDSIGSVSWQGKPSARSMISDVSSAKRSQKSLATASTDLEDSVTSFGQPTDSSSKLNTIKLDSTDKEMSLAEAMEVIASLKTEVRKRDHDITRSKNKLKQVSKEKESLSKQNAQLNETLGDVKNGLLEKEEKIKSLDLIARTSEEKIQELNEKLRSAENDPPMRNYDNTTSIDTNTDTNSIDLSASQTSLCVPEIVRKFEDRAAVQAAASLSGGSEYEKASNSMLIQDLKAECALLISEKEELIREHEVEEKQRQEDLQIIQQDIDKKIFDLETENSQLRERLEKHHCGEIDSRQNLSNRIDNDDYENALKIIKEKQAEINILQKKLGLITGEFEERNAKELLGKDATIRQLQEELLATRAVIEAKTSDQYSVEMKAQIRSLSSQVNELTKRIKDNARLARKDMKEKETALFSVRREATQLRQEIERLENREKERLGDERRSATNDIQNYITDLEDEVLHWKKVHCELEEELIQVKAEAIDLQLQLDEEEEPLGDDDDNSIGSFTSQLSRQSRRQSMNHTSFANQDALSMSHQSFTSLSKEDMFFVPGSNVAGTTKSSDDNDDESTASASRRAIRTVSGLWNKMTQAPPQARVGLYQQSLDD